MRDRQVDRAIRMLASAVLGLLLARPDPAVARARPRPAGPATMQPFPGAPDVIPCDSSPPRMNCIPGGPFRRGTDEGPAPARPASVVFVQTFHMDRFEVTVADFRACIQTGDCPDAGPKYADYNRPRQPITGVSWYDAAAYCRTHGKHLPTEAEWEKAARGTDGRLYSWGNEPITCARAVYMDDSGRSCGTPKTLGSHPETGRPLEVGSRPAGIYGLYDMIGNAFEWTADWFSDSWAVCGAACAGVDPRGPCGGAEPCPGHLQRTVRGGSWFWPAEYNTTVYRRPHVPANQPEFHHFGFRCAASPAEAAATRAR